MMNFKILIFSVLLGLTYGGSMISRALIKDQFYPKLYDREKAIIPDEEKLDQDNCNCRLPVENKIIGGENEDPNKFVPWQVAIVGKILVAGNEKWDLLCGGVVVNKLHIITEGTCVRQIEDHTERFKVVVGTYDLNEMNENNMYDIEDCELDVFSSNLLPGDVGFVKLKNPLEFSVGLVEPACLSVEKTLRYKEKLMATGYGLTTQTFLEYEEVIDDAIDLKKTILGKESEVLKKAYFFEDPTLKHEEIEENFKQEDNYCDTYLICMTSDKDESPCNGDNGGPVHYTDKGITKVEGLIGLYSTKKVNDLKYSICHSPWFGVRLSHLANYIESIVGDEYCKEPAKKESLNS